MQCAWYDHMCKTYFERFCTGDSAENCSTGLEFDRRGNVTVWEISFLTCWRCTFHLSSATENRPLFDVKYVMTALCSLHYTCTPEEWNGIIHWSYAMSNLHTPDGMVDAVIGNLWAICIGRGYCRPMHQAGRAGADDRLGTRCI